jgi:hypothetical protein
LSKKVIFINAAVKAKKLLKYTDAKPDLVELVCDLAQAKKNIFMPGCPIPIIGSNIVNYSKLDFFYTLSWNIGTGVKVQLSTHAKLIAFFVTAVPHLAFTI